jgi:hypothetical protein
VRLEDVREPGKSRSLHRRGLRDLRLFDPGHVAAHSVAEFIPLLPADLEYAIVPILAAG